MDWYLVILGVGATSAAKAARQPQRGGVAPTPNMTLYLLVNRCIL